MRLLVGVGTFGFRVRNSPEIMILILSVQFFQQHMLSGSERRSTLAWD